MRSSKTIFFVACTFQTVLICQTWYNSMLEKNFYRAKEFLPERWLNYHGEPEGEKFWPHRESVCTHFGYGKRMCPGKRYAFQELCIIVAKVIYHLDSHLIILLVPCSSSSSSSSSSMYQPARFFFKLTLSKPTC